jgi:hypothetical protein
LAYDVKVDNKHTADAMYDYDKNDTSIWDEHV